MLWVGVDPSLLRHLIRDTRLGAEGSFVMSQEDRKYWLDKVAKDSSELQLAPAELQGWQGSSDECFHPAMEGSPPCLWEVEERPPTRTSDAGRRPRLDCSLLRLWGSEGRPRSSDAGRWPKRDCSPLRLWRPEGRPRSGDAGRRPRRGCSPMRLWWAERRPWSSDAGRQPKWVCSPLRLWGAEGRPRSSDAGRRPVRESPPVCL